MGAEALQLGHLSVRGSHSALGAIEGPAPCPSPGLGEPPRDGWLRGLGDDLRFALRSLRKSPALTVVALLTLTLGIGANATIFSVVNAILVRPLPFPDPDRLVSFWGTAPDKGLPVVAYPDALYAYYRERAKTV